MKNIHFIAIGGAIMHQLALALQRQGYNVTGSDDEINDPARSNLKAAGLLPAEIGWHRNLITSNLDAVVLGMHAKENNPELVEAKRLGVPVYSFPQYVYEVSKDKLRVVVAGSHGKTTITSMIMHILKLNGKDIDYLVGARVQGFDESVRLGDATTIIIEGDEYPASAEEKRPKIFFYHPQISVLSGIAWDHINVFPTYEIYFDQFMQYLNGMVPGSKLFYNTEDSEVVRAVNSCTSAIIKVPYSTPAFEYRDGVPVIRTAEGEASLSVFGRHNIQNTQAAIQVCVELGIPLADCYRAISSFKGAARRLEKVSESEGLKIYRDFAHAPSKLKATLTAVREAYPNSYLVACFELHTFSSLNEQFLAEYRNSMDVADRSLVFYSHHAIALKGLNELSKDAVKEAFGRDDLEVIDDKNTLEIKVKSAIQGHDRPVFLLLMSSGTFEGIDWNDVSSHNI